MSEPFRDVEFPESIENRKTRLLKTPEGWTEYMNDGFSSCYGLKGFFDKENADRCFRRIKRQGKGKWDRETVKIKGKEYKMNRMTIHYGDEGTKFRYSGVRMKPIPWDKTVERIKDILNETLKLNLNFCVATIYKDGLDKIGDHSDKLRDMEETVVVSISFGATRDFLIKPRSKALHSKPISCLYTRDKNGRSNFRVVIPLAHGDLAIMAGDMQSCWFHSVPERKNTKYVTIDGYGTTLERINLTFRVMKNEKEKQKGIEQKN